MDRRPYIENLSPADALALRKWRWWTAVVYSVSLLALIIGTAVIPGDHAVERTAQAPTNINVVPSLPR